MSDFSDSDTEIDIHEEKFRRASKHVEAIHTQLTPNDLLELYGLFKQATCGQCNTAKPGIFNMQGRAKWSSWHDLGDMQPSQAKLLYFEKVKILDPKWCNVANQADKTGNKVGWVVHSTELRPEEIDRADHEKTSFDHVKEGNLERLKTSLSTQQLQELDEHGMGLIHWATDRNLAETLHYLLMGGADVNLRDSESQTALHYAASCGHLQCLRILLSFNADRSAQDADGQTPLDVAESAEIRSLLSN